MGPGIGSSSPGVIGHGSMTSMGSAPTPRNLMSANAFVSTQGLHNRNLSDLGSYLELLSLSAGQEQVLVTSPPERIASCRLPFRLQCFVVWVLTCCRAASVDIGEAASPLCLLPASCSMRLFIISGKHSPSCLIWRVVFHNPCDLVTPAGAWSGGPVCSGTPCSRSTRSRLRMHSCWCPLLLCRSLKATLSSSITYPRSRSSRRMQRWPCKPLSQQPCPTEVRATHPRVR